MICHCLQPNKKAFETDKKVYYKKLSEAMASLAELKGRLQ